MLKLIFVLCLLLSCTVSQITDYTTVPGSMGPNVVRAVLSKLDESSIFEQSGNNDLTNVFLRNMAFVETRDGTDIPDNATAINGGMWNITDIQFQQTINLTRTNIRLSETIASYLGQDWMDVDYRDLAKPLYSGLAARLYLTHIVTERPIPPTESQGPFWSRTFKEGSGDVQGWTNATTLLQQIEGKYNIQTHLV